MHHLPDVKSELVIPLRIGKRVIGTLDVQSNKLNDFEEEDVVVIQSLGDQISIAIENARLYQRSRELAVLEERTASGTRATRLCDAVSIQHRSACEGDLRPHLERNYGQGARTDPSAASDHAGEPSGNAFADSCPAACFDDGPDLGPSA